MFLSDRYHFEHNGTCAPGTPFLDQTFSTCNVLSCPDVFSMYCAILLRCFLQVLRFLPRRFLHVMCFPAQMFSPGTPFLALTFFTCNVLSLKISSIYRLEVNSIILLDRSCLCNTNCYKMCLHISYDQNKT
jgi:hypothetical protein